MSTPEKWLDAAAQAENMRLREALAKRDREANELADPSGIHYSNQFTPEYVRSALATPPGSRAALREMLVKASMEAWNFGHELTSCADEEVMMRDPNEVQREDVEDIVSRLFGEEGGKS